MALRYGFALMVAALSSAPAMAQTAPAYDPNCKRIAADDEVFKEACQPWNVFCRAGQTMARWACPKVELVRKLVSPNANKLEIDDVFEEAKPSGPPALTSLELKRIEKKAEQHLKDREERARDEYLRANPANEAATELNRRIEEARIKGVPLDVAPAPQGGFIMVFKNETANAQRGNGDGYLIDDEGLSRGHFEQGRLTGTGQEISGDGGYRGGEYDAGKLDGEGFEMDRVDGQLQLTTGTYVADTPDGITTVTLEDGSSRRDLWERQHIAYRGNPAPAGTAPADPPAQGVAETAPVPVVLSRTGPASGKSLIESGIQRQAAWEADRGPREARERVERAEIQRRVAEANRQYAEWEAKRAAREERNRQRAANGGGFDWGGLLLGVAQAYVGVKQAEQQARDAYRPPAYTPPAPVYRAPAPAPAPQQSLAGPAPIQQQDATACVRVTAAKDQYSLPKITNTCSYPIRVYYSNRINRSEEFYAGETKNDGGKGQPAFRAIRISINGQ